MNVGPGDLVHFVDGREAALALPDETFVPVDAAVVGLQIEFQFVTFNVNYVGLKHLWYTAEFPVRDYVQDVGLKQVLRYALLISLLLTGNGLLCEP